MSIFEAADYAVAALRRADFGRAQASMRLRTAQRKHPTAAALRA
ncbi:hypothetical protein [Mesorhizobium sp. M1233]